MDPAVTVRAEESPERPLAVAAQALCAEIKGEPFEGFRSQVEVPTARLSVSDTTAQLRKNELLRILQSGAGSAGRQLTRRAADVLGISIDTVRKYIRTPEFQQKLWMTDQKLWQRVDEELEVSKKSICVRIAELSELALENMERLMMGPDDGLAYKASADILDRNPEASKRTHSESVNTTLNIDPAQLMQAALVAREMEARHVNRTPELGAPASA